MKWFDADPQRLVRERPLLRKPWHLIERDGRMAWVGGTLRAASGNIAPPDRAAELIYPAGYPARFIEVRLIPDPPQDHWAQLGTHVNADGSVCFVTAESWTPQMTAADALGLASDWWFNYWLIVEKNCWMAPWPRRGKATLSSGARAALYRR